ncbi:MAG: carbon storage regulator [Proteobacteria bacterium]|nr:carbon storage regulator [Pseudomonadota bacterium]
MLTLTRKPEETIVIGDGPERIEVIVKEIRRNQVRLGIVAPEDVRIFRKELIERDEALQTRQAEDLEEPR